MNNINTTAILKMGTKDKLSINNTVNTLKKKKKTKHKSHNVDNKITIRIHVYREKKGIISKMIIGIMNSI